MRTPLRIVSILTLAGAVAGGRGVYTQSVSREDLGDRADRLWRTCRELDAGGDTVAGMATCDALLVVLRQLGPSADKHLVATLDWLGSAAERIGDYKRAQGYEEQTSAPLDRVTKPGDWRRTGNRLHLERLRQILARPEAERKALAEAERQQETAEDLLELGKIDEAKPFAERSNEIRERLLGQQSLDTAESLNTLGLVYGQSDDPSRAASLLTRALAIRRALLGAQHPDSAAVVSNLSMLAGASGDYEKGLRLAIEARAAQLHVLEEDDEDVRKVRENVEFLVNEVARLAQDTERAGAFGDAARLLDLAAEGQRSLHGADSAEVKKTLGDLERVKALVRKPPDDAAERAAMRNRRDLARELQRKGRIRDAIAEATEVVRSYKRAFGETDRDTATELDYLGLLYLESGQVNSAATALRDALRIRRDHFGERDPDVAVSENNVGAFYYSIGDLARAEAQFRRAHDIAERSRGHEWLANTAQNNAAVVAWGGPVKQIPFNARELQGTIRSDPTFRAQADAEQLAQLAAFRQSMGSTTAQSLLEEALRRRRVLLGDDHPAVANSLTTLARYFERVGDLRRSEQNHKEALEIRAVVLPSDHPDNVPDLIGLGFAAAAQGRTTDAARLYKRGLAIARTYVDLAATAQSSRQQLTMLARERAGLEKYLSLATEGKIDAGEAWKLASAWKGSVLSRQRRQRTASRTTQSRRTWAELQAVASELAIEALATPSQLEASKWRSRVAALSAQKELLEADLARMTGVAASAPYEVEATPDHLPGGVAFVDIYEYVHSSTVAAKKATVSKDKKRTGVGALPQSIVGTAPTPTHVVAEEVRFAAFVVRSGRQVHLVDVGSRDVVAEAIAAWRSAVSRATGNTAPGEVLRKTVWAPIEAALGETGADHVVLSLDGALGQLPFGALPGRRSGTVLLQERPLSTVPDVGALFEMASTAPPARDGDLLLVGNVDYGSVGGDRAPSERTRQAAVGGSIPFGPLRGSEEEVSEIERLHASAYPTAARNTLRSVAATSVATSSALGNFRFVHLATHGYFAAPRFQSVLRRQLGERGAGPSWGTDQSVSVYAPGLLSGIVLAGANLPAGESEGILTAEQIASLRLPDVSLVVLSSCESGLGEAAAGEGTIGLQRAFHASGVSSVVASLWKVPDVATRDLMLRFYGNMWVRGLGRLDALREAQLWMATQAVARYRPMVAESERRVGETTGADSQNDAFYWAAFQLSGDWR